MTKNVLSALFNAARGLLRNFGALLALAVLYAALIAAAVLFVTTREATVFQIGLTAVCAVAAPVLFFLVASAAASYAVGESRPLGLLGRAARNFLKVLLVSIPMLALVVGTVWGMNKLESRVRHDPREEASEQYSSAQNETADEGGGADSADKPKPPVRWAYVFYSALRLFLLGFVLPLVAIHLWLVAALDGLKAVVVNLHRVILRALSARAVFTYAVGLIVFALLPYFLIIKRTPASAGSLELSLLGIRLVAAFALTLFGFVATMAALARDRADDATETVPARQPLPPPRVEETASATS
jgi:Na+-transporting methylmalonyl-CoA/oxaloacetate decarboxylase gamma subunit